MSDVRVELQGQVLLVTIDREEALNAIDRSVHAGLGAALEQAERERGIRVVAVTGAGSVAFSAGADLRALQRGESLMPDDPREAAWGYAGFVRHHISKPTIAAVNGMALGLGLEIALASDLVVAAEHATFGLPEVKHGVIAGAGGVFRLPTQIPPKTAMEMILTGDSISARRAAELGLVNRVVPAAALLETALELAERVAANGPLAVAASKCIAGGIVDGTRPDEREAWEQVESAVRELMASDEAAEGLRAFVEKRPPCWSGR